MLYGPDFLVENVMEERKKEGMNCDLFVRKEQTGYKVPIAD